MPELSRIPAIFLLVVLVTAFAGCGEDRSNLLPEDAVTEITTEIDEVQDLVSQGECFSADIAAERARTRVEALGPEVDAKLKKSLLDGVTQLQVTVKNRCEEVDTTTTTTTAEPEEPTGTTDTTVPSGTTDSGNGTTGNNGDGGGKSGGGDNGGNPAPEPSPQPNPEPSNPTNPQPNPQPPSQPDNGSGGVGPSSGG